MNKYYNILGLEPGASEEEIKKAWKKKALEWHPDRNPSEEAKTKIQEINEAYEILSGKKKVQQEEPIPNPFSRNPFRGGGFRMKARPLNLIIDLTVEEVFHGVVKNIQFNVDRICDSCNGAGGKTNVCPICRGKGMHIQHNSRFGMQTMTMCSNCGGSGTIVVENCKSCNGRSVINKVEKITVKIPRGTIDESKIIATNAGNDVVGAMRGDVFFTINVLEHPLYELEGLNVNKKEEISFVDMVLGAEIEVETLGGKYKITVPSGCESNQIFRMKGLGLIDEDTDIKGDLYLMITPKIPKEITEEEKSILENLKNSKNFS